MNNITDFQLFLNILPVLIPILLFQLSFQIYCIINLTKQDRVRYISKWLWVLVILLFNVLGGIIYLLAGREE